MKAKIVLTGTKFGLFDQAGFLVQSYSRHRDAARGAKRRGMIVV